MFVHLRLHTEFSVVDGTNRIDEVVKAAAADGQPSLAITDLNNLFGAVKFYKEARSKGVKPVLGAEVYLEGLADMAAKRGLKTVAIVNEDTLFPKASMAGFAETAKKRGMQVVLQEAYPKGNTDFSALLVKIKSLNPDVIAAGTYFDDAVAITRQMKELNVNPKMFGLTVGGDLPEFHDLLKQNADYVYGATQWDETLPYPGQKEFLAAYTKRMSLDDIMNDVMSMAFAPAIT